jgi:predicted permease
MHDFRLAVRALRANPVVSAMAILSLALGIGANTAIFSLVNSLLLRQLPVRDPGALVLLTDSTVPGTRTYAYPVWEEFRRLLSERPNGRVEGPVLSERPNGRVEGPVLSERPNGRVEGQLDVFDGALAWSSAEFNLTSRGEREFVDGLLVNGSFFDALGVEPVLGRALSEADDRPGGGPDGPVTVISHGFWQRRLGGAADVVGRTLTLDGASFTIVGVAPADFSGVDVGRTFDAIVPFGTMRPLRGRESWPAVTIMARLRAGQTREAATVALRRVQPQIRDASLPRVASPRWREQDRERYLREDFVLVPGATGNSRLRLRYERPLLTLMVVVALVLLMTCVNIANLLLARAIARQHELQVRIALGAGRWRLVRDLLTESAVLAAAGSTLGMLAALWGSRLLVRQLSTQSNPIHLDLSVDGHVLGFTVGITALATLLFGMAPAARALGVVAADALRTNPLGGWRHTRSGTAGALIVAQVALSVVLAVGAGLFLRTFSSLATLPLGFEPDRVLTASVSTDDARARPEQRLALFDRAREAVRSLPGVADAAFSFLTPVSGPILLRPIELPDVTSLPESERLSSVNLVSPGWFNTLGTPIVAGREFTDGDRTGAPPVVVVNQAFVRKFLKGASPLGRVVTIGIVGPNAGAAEVVGVAADAIYSSLREPVPPTIYFPLAQLRSAPPASLTLSIRSEKGSPQVLSRSVAAAIRSVNPDLALAFRPLTDQINASLAQDRVVAMLSGFFGGVAVLLAGLGLFGVTSYSVSRRRREIGIRVALGAAPGAVLRLVFARLSLLVGTGVVIGAAVSLWASQLVAPLLFGLEPRDPATLIGAVVLLAAVGVLAGWRPAWRAARIDPAVVLRSE